MANGTPTQLSPIVAAALAKFNALSSPGTKAGAVGVKPGARADTMRAAFKKAGYKAPRKAAQEPVKRGLNPASERWVYEALVLPVTLQKCRNCRREQEVAGGKLLLRRRCRTTGAIWESSEGATSALPPLPHLRRVHEAFIEACPRCYGGVLNLATIECLRLAKPVPVPEFDTPSAYAAARAIAAMRPAAPHRPDPDSIPLDTRSAQWSPTQAAHLTVEDI